MVMKTIFVAFWVLGQARWPLIFLIILLRILLQIGPLQGFYALNKMYPSIFCKGLSGLGLEQVPNLDVCLSIPYLKEWGFRSAAVFANIKDFLKE